MPGAVLHFLPSSGLTSHGLVASFRAGLEVRASWVIA